MILMIGPCSLNEAPPFLGGCPTNNKVSYMFKKD